MLNYIKNFFSLKISDGRIFGLDLLRAVAVITVVFEHSVGILPNEISICITKYLYYDGVTIFFVLSGFLIGGILIKVVNQDGFSRRTLFNFWIRRWFRTLPNYLLFVFILALLSKLFIPGFPLRVVPQYLLFLQNVQKVSPGFFGESWSLSVEEWFYLCIPLFIFTLLKITTFHFKNILLFTAILVFCFSVLNRFIVYYCGFPEQIGDYRRVVIMRLDTIMLGVIASLIKYYYVSFWCRNTIISSIIGITLIFIWKITHNQYGIFTFYYANIYFLLIGFGIVFLLPLLDSFTIEKYTIISTGITYISLISYSLYLIHYSLVKKLLLDNIFAAYFKNIPIFQITIKYTFYWVFSLLGAFIIYKYFEVPMIKLRDRIKI